MSPWRSPGPDGRPYTLADFQRLAAENNPGLRQAASDVEAARGAHDPGWPLSQPDVGYETNPNANNTGSASRGLSSIK